MKITKEMAVEYCKMTGQDPQENEELPHDDGVLRLFLLPNWVQVQEYLSAQLPIFELFISHFFKNTKFDIKTPLQNFRVNFKIDGCNIEPILENKE